MKRKTAESDAQGQQATSFSHAGVTVDIYRSLCNPRARFSSPMGVEYGDYSFAPGTSATTQDIFARAVCATIARINRRKS